MSKYRPLVAVDADIISSYGEKPLLKLTGGYACDDTAAALHALCVELPWMRVTDCFRDVDVQIALRKRYDYWVKKGKPAQYVNGKKNPAYDDKTMKNAFVAMPGKSLHNAGRAVDLNTELMQKHLGKEYLDAFWPIAAKHGFTPIIGRPDEGASESWHFDHRGPWLPVFKHLGSGAGSLCCTLDVGQAGEFQSDEALIQALLLRAGYDIGDPDGIVGKRTAAALKLALGADYAAKYPHAEMLIDGLRALDANHTWKKVSG
jgi:hypothetical protein